MRDLVGAGLALFLATLSILLAAPQIQRNSQQMLDAPAAYQVQALTQAASSYLSTPANFTAVAAAAASANIFIVPSTLQGAGALDSSFVNSNRYGQMLGVIVHEVSATQLQALVITCGGTAMSDAAVRHLIQLAGGATKGGGIPAVGIYSTNTTAALGATGGLSVALASFAGTSCTPAAGHIGAALFLDGSQVIPDYLFRDPVPGAGTGPNTMNTALLMGGHDVNNAANVNATVKVTSPTFADSTNPTQWFVTPAGTSQINAVYANAYYQTSDRSLKTNIRPIEDALGLVERLTGHRFDWAATGAPDLGFVAQEIQPVLPEAIGVRPDGKLSVKYDIVAAPLVEAVKALAARVRQLEAQQNVPPPSQPPDHVAGAQP